MEQILSLDFKWFSIVNGRWIDPIADAVMPVLTDLHRISWGPYVLVLFLISFFLVDYKRATFMTMALGLVIGTTDNLAHGVLKPYFHRERPGYTVPGARILGPNHTGYSFPSNHAANMAAATNTIGYFFPPVLPLAGFVALVVAYSRVYVGAHFPFDVLAGLVWGLMVSGLFRIFFNALRTFIRVQVRQREVKHFRHSARNLHRSYRIKRRVRRHK